MVGLRIRIGLAGWLLLTAVPAGAADETWSLHGQATLVEQYHPAFRSPYEGANSLDPGSRGDETFDATLFAGARLWAGGEAYANPEIDQGFGLSNTLGLAGFSSGEAYKVGKAEPYFRLQRLFFRQTFDLGGESENLEPGANQLGSVHTTDRLTLTAGKFSVADIFDASNLAHDPKSDFLNWSVIDSGAFDYAADAWGYSYGMAAEWRQDWWTLRLGLFDLSRVPNTTELETGFGQFELVAEGEARQDWFGRTGTLKLLGFLNRGRMGGYAEALAQAAGGVPDTAQVRRYAARAGGALIVEQPLSDDLALFLRASLNDGSKEAYEFTEINASAALGFALKGGGWGRPGDTLGLALVRNALSAPARAYFAAGGLGILIGDGRLRYGGEQIVESYYSLAVTDGLALSLDYQVIANPAYNRDRGPVSILGGRVHAAF